jgi:hypothetical protein
MVTKHDDILAGALSWAEREAANWQVSSKPKRAKPPISSTPETQREAFSRNVGLALDNIRQVLELELDPDDPNYRATLQAKTTMASNVITSALKADDNRLKERQLDNGNIYAELKRRLEEYRAKKRGQLPQPAAHDGGTIQ